MPATYTIAEYIRAEYIYIYIYVMNIHLLIVFRCIRTVLRTRYVSASLSALDLTSSRLTLANSYSAQEGPRSKGNISANSNHIGFVFNFDLYLSNLLVWFGLGAAMRCKTH